MSGIVLALVVGLAAVSFVSMQPKAYASPCTNLAASVYRAAFLVAQGELNTGIRTNNQALITQGSAHLSSAINVYTTSLLSCSGIHV